MLTDEQKNKLCAAIQKQAAAPVFADALLRTPLGQQYPDYKLADDLGLDSLDIFELALQAEEIVPGFDSYKLEMNPGSTLLDFFAAIEKAMQ